MGGGNPVIGTHHCDLERTQNNKEIQDICEIIAMIDFIPYYWRLVPHDYRKDIRVGHTVLGYKI